MKKNQKETILIFVLLVVVAGIFGIYFIFRNKVSTTPSVSDSNPIYPSPAVRTDIQLLKEEERPTDAPVGKEVVRVTFDYVVSRVDDQSIILSGENGEFTVPKDTAMVTVYQVVNNVESLATLDDVQPGQNIRLDMIPGERIWIYILSS